MTDQLAAAEMLRRAAAELASVEDPAVRWLAAGLGVVLSGHVRSLDAALGLLPGQSQRRWQTVLATARRDELLRHAATFYGGSATAKAKALAKDLSDYASDCWPRERRLPSMPPRHVGKPQEVFYRIMKVTAGRVPGSHRQIANILRGAVTKEISIDISFPPIGSNIGSSEA